MVLLLIVDDGEKVKKGQLICYWDPYNALIIAEVHRNYCF